MIISKRINIRIEVSNISVGRRYFTFDYAVYDNGVLKEKGEYGSGHCRSPQSIRKWLKDDYAFELITQKIYGS